MNFDFIEKSNVVTVVSETTKNYCNQLKHGVISKHNNFPICRLTSENNYKYKQR